MTSLWTFSDLHQECDENAWDPQVAAPSTVDAVVCAGDVHVPLIDSVQWLADRFAGKPVILVPGNYEFWRAETTDRYSYQDQVMWARDIAANKDIDLLVDGEVVLVGDTRIVGGTLWTDYALRPGYLPLSGAMAQAASGCWTSINSLRRQSEQGQH